MAIATWSLPDKILISWKPRKYRFSSRHGASNSGMPEEYSISLPGGSDFSMRSYPAPWKGQLLLACGKCRRKLKRGSTDNAVRKLAKSLKRRSKQDQDGFRLRVIEVACLKMCPKGGVCVCTQAQLGCGECSIIRTAADVNALYALCKAEDRKEFAQGHAA